MEVIKYRNIEGSEVYIGPSSPYYLISTEGFGAVENVLTTQKSFNLDGDTFISQSLDSRLMRIEGTVVRNKLNNLADDRKELTKAFNPKIAGTIIYKLFNKRYMIDVKVEHAPVFRKSNNQELIDFEIRLRALDPYWMDTTFYDSLIPLSTKENDFKFPLVITEAFVFATLHSGNIIEINNNGDVTVGAEFRLKTYGEVTNPRIYNVLTQEYFGFKGTYLPGTEFSIVTRRGEKQVTKTFNGETTNAMGERMPGSTFLTLKKGLNYLQIQADDALDAVFGELNFTPLVMGV